MAQTHSPSSQQARSIVGPALLLETSQMRHSSDCYVQRLAQHHADQDLLRLLIATTLCGFGLLVLAVLH